jgi:predicted nucleic acid-binding protein
MTPKSIIVDSCFWFALFDSKDEYHDKADLIDTKYQLDRHKILLPWPSLFEVLNEKFMMSEKIHWREKIKKGLRNNYELIDDSSYKDDALNSVLKQKELSLVDQVINLMMEDIKLNIKAIITFNVKDFETVARKRTIEVISE